MSEGWLIALARSGDLAAARRLIKAYQRELNVDLCFQNFADEMRRFPAGYELVLIAREGEVGLGCVCLKRLEAAVCEMKRLFVATNARGSGIGRALCLGVISEAAERGYTQIKLDTLRRLTPALALYRSLGFLETAPYTPNPEPDVVYLSKPL